MLTTNLLPQTEKEMMAHDAMCRIIVFFAACLITIFAAGSALLLPSYLPLVYNIRELAETLATEEQATAQLQVNEVNDETKTIRSSLIALESFFAKPSRATLLLDEFFSRAKNIAIISLVIDKQRTFSLQGRAQRRQDLLEFERLLRESGLAQEFSLPLSQIVRETNVSFSIQGKLKPNKGL